LQRRFEHCFRGWFIGQTFLGEGADFDLYRLGKSEDVYELGFEEALGGAILLIEWPERLGPLLPRERLDVELAAGASPTRRRARLRGSPAWTRRLASLASP